MSNLNSCKYIIGVPDLWPHTHCNHIYCLCQLINLYLSSALAYLFYSHPSLTSAYLTSRTYISLSTHVHHLCQLLYSHSSPYLLTSIICISLSTYIYHLCQPIYSHPLLTSAYLLMSITHVSLFNHVHHPRQLF
jgi:hypothetical protein